MGKASTKRDDIGSLLISKVHTVKAYKQKLYFLYFFFLFQAMAESINLEECLLMVVSLLMSYLPGLFKTGIFLQVLPVLNMKSAAYKTFSLPGENF